MAWLEYRQWDGVPGTNLVATCQKLPSSLGMETTAAQTFVERGVGFLEYVPRGRQRRKSPYALRQQMGSRQQWHRQRQLKRNYDDGGANNHYRRTSKCYG